MQFLLFFLSLLTAFTAVNCGINFYNWFSGQPKYRDTWVLLIAGSNGWYNYRHQADVCHAYQIVRSHGIPESRIITMMYDDVAYDPLNPYPGQLFNEPGGPNVYGNFVIDYKGDAITPENILAVMTGNQSAVHGGNGRVVNSTSKDNIFIYFSDHGGTGLLSVIDEALYANQINDALLKMYKDRRYHQLVFYVEACESGSIFNDLLPDNINVYAVTAANSTQSSYAYYCEGQIPLINNCLGDEFSIRWMQDASKEDLTLTQLGLQYKTVKSQVLLSHVCRFGDITMMSRRAAEFMGSAKAKQNTTKNLRTANNEKPSAWPSRDIPLLSVQRAMERESDVGRKAELAEQLKSMKAKRQYLDNFMHDFAVTFLADQNEITFDDVFSRRPMKITQIECHQSVVDAFIHKCFSLGKNQYALNYIYILVNLCEYKFSTEKILKHIDSKCSNIQMQGIH